jgi:hypothetical protein
MFSLFIHHSCSAGRPGAGPRARRAVLELSLVTACLFVVGGILFLPTPGTLSQASLIDATAAFRCDAEKTSAPSHFVAVDPDDAARDASDDDDSDGNDSVSALPAATPAAPADHHGACALVASTPAPVVAPQSDGHALRGPPACEYRNQPSAFGGSQSVGSFASHRWTPVESNPDVQGPLDTADRGAGDSALPVGPASPLTVGAGAIDSTPQLRSALASVSLSLRAPPP